MPPLDTLPKPRWTTAPQIVMSLLGGFLIVAAIMVVVKFVQLASTGGHCPP